MDNRLPDDAVAFAAAAAGRFEKLGGVNLARHAERDHGARHAAATALAELGIGDLDVRADPEHLLAAAALCRAAGAVVLPWPVVSDLLAIDEHRIALIDERAVRVDHGDLPLSWVVADLDGQAWAYERAGAAPAGRLGPFVTRGTLGPASIELSADDVARWLVLGAWQVLGGIETAFAGVCLYLRQRVQFGRPLAEFQAVRFTVADTQVRVRGLEELAKYTSWRLAGAATSPAERTADALALRLHAVEAARAVLRTCHQLYGAVGFCDETDVSVIDRHLQPLLRFPVSPEVLAQRLIPAIGRGDLRGLGR
jgi:hypothetical protein